MLRTTIAQSCRRVQSSFTAPKFFPLLPQSLSPVLCRQSSKYTSNQHFRNGQIPHETVQVLDAETGLAGPPVRLNNLLEQVKLKHNVVLLVSSEPSPTVKILSKEEFADLKQKDKPKKKKKPQETKSVQMTWGIEDGDFQHKMGKAKLELEKGNTVRIILARGKGTPKPTQQETEEKLREMQAILEDVAVVKDNSTAKGITVMEFRPQQK